MNHERKAWSITVLSMAITVGCNGPETAPAVRYGDSKAVETLSADFGSTDLQLIAEKMVTSLLESSAIRPDGDSSRPPIVSVARVKNRTSEHIDMKAITDKIRTTMIKSGKVRFAATDMQNDLMDQYDFQAASASASTRKSYGSQSGAKYILAGEIMSIVKTAGREKDVYYKITLNLVDIQSGVIEWADEKEIRKGSTRKLIGS
ncbi:MAG: penicillin-binding protein activator LpoB [Holophagaceae bacterium]|nr:penicillin-binding protein activator LpoB [Holophagaceae bacterium]